MLTPDYQEFAKRAPVSIRDNTVICALSTSGNGGNPSGVAALPRQGLRARETVPAELLMLAPGGADLAVSR